MSKVEITHTFKIVGDNKDDIKRKARDQAADFWGHNGYDIDTIDINHNVRTGIGFRAEVQTSSYEDIA